LLENCFVFLLIRKLLKRVYQSVWDGPRDVFAFSPRSLSKIKMY